MKIRLPTLLPKLREVLWHIEKNAHFALSEAMTATVEYISIAEKADLKRKFTIRTNWVPQGVKFWGASKGEKKPEAVVGFVKADGKPTAPIALLHEQGGTHQKASGHRLGVPAGVRGAGGKGLTPPKLWPKNIIGKGKKRERGFIMETKKGFFLVQATEMEHIRRKVQRSRLAKKGKLQIISELNQSHPQKFKFLYKMVPSSSIKPDLKFYDQIPRARKVFGAMMVESLRATLGGKF